MKKIVIQRKYLAEVFYARRRIKFPPSSRYSKYSMFISSDNIEESAGDTIEIKVNDKLVAKERNHRAEFSVETLQKIFNGEDVCAEKVYNVKSDKVLETRINYLSDVIPKEMQALPNWVVYKTRWNEQKQKKDKTLISPLSGRWAKSDDKTTWTDFETAKKYAIENDYDGLAFALNGDGITCIDLDHSIGQDGVPNAMAKRYLEEFNDTYCETSVSGNGLHIFLKDDILCNDTYKNRVVIAGGEIEVYDKKRFISMTGNNRTTVNKLSTCQAIFKEKLQIVLGKRAIQHNIKRGQVSINSVSDAELIAKISASRKGAEFDSLMKGISLTGDHSRDDMKMFNILAFFSNSNAIQMESIFKASGLYRPEKGDKYIQISIAKAINTLSKPISNRKTQREKGYGNNNGRY